MFGVELVGGRLGRSLRDWYGLAELMGGLCSILILP